MQGKAADPSKGLAAACKSSLYRLFHSLYRLSCSLYQVFSSLYRLFLQLVPSVRRVQAGSRYLCMFPKADLYGVTHLLFHPLIHTSRCLHVLV